MLATGRVELVKESIRCLLFGCMVTGFLSCHSSSEKLQRASVRVDTVIVHDTIYTQMPTSDWQDRFHLTHDDTLDTVWGRPVAYYIDDPDCSGAAADFYAGQFHPTDNGATSDLLQLAETDNAKLRPFYRWCLDCTILISDGALTELTGIPARRYAEKFPREFFRFVDADTAGDRYQRWVDAIGYSGFLMEENSDSPKEMYTHMTKAMLRNFPGHTITDEKRVRRFVGDCVNGPAGKTD